MDKLRDYSIEFVGLKDARHEWNFNLDSTFFELLESTVIEDGKFSCKVLLDKTATLLTFTFEINGEFVSFCDDCLDELVVPISANGKLYVKFGEEYEEQTEEIIVIKRDENQINIAQYIYEFIVLSMPMRVVHPEDSNGNSTCNAEMMSKLSHYLVSEINEDGDEEGENEYEDEFDEQGEENEAEIDPRWASLKKLIDNNKKEV